MSRNILKYSAVVASLLVTALVAGCGTSNKEGNLIAGDVAKVSEAACAQCHSTAIDHVDGTRIYDAYLASKHFSSGKVGCQDCHGGGSQHNGVGPLPYPDPAAAGKCFECHKKYLPEAHFRNMTSGPDAFSSAMYVTKNYEKACTACHDPHKADKGITQQHTDWAESGHGDVNGLAWATEDFKENASCIRCHTATGFINYIESDFALPTTTFASADDKGREVLTCKACHTDYNYKNRVREVRGFTAPYGIVKGVAKAPMTYDNVGNSNMCVVCHSGRESGASMVATVSDFGNSSFKNPHYLAAAAVFYGKGGFKYYSSAIRYQTQYGVVADGVIIPVAAASANNGTPAIAVGDKMVGAKANWSHGKLGMNNYQSSKTAAYTAKGDLVFTGTGGQCVACHLGAGAKAGNHTLGAYEVAKSTWVTGGVGANARGCYGCHTDEDIEEVGDLDEKPRYDRAMAFFQWQLLQSGIKYTTDYPYFFQPGTTKAVKNWTATASATNGPAVGPATGTGAKNMGAAMNFKLLKAEKGAHVHNRTFMKQMIFDSVQYLQNGAVTYSNRNVLSGKTDINAVINFSNYSAAVTPVGGGLPNDLTGNTRSITDLKGYIIRKTTSGATGGTSSVPVYTRY